MQQPTFDIVIAALRRLGLTVFSSDAKPFNLNIVGVRSANRVAGKMDDWLCVFWNDPWFGWRFYAFPCTTDSGSFYHLHPISPKGTARMIAPQQVRGLWKVGWTKIGGGHFCLRQAAPAQYSRDNDKDVMQDDEQVEETAIIHAHIHRGPDEGRVLDIGKWSAACWVLAEDRDFEWLMEVVEAAKKNWGNSFTGTLLREEDLT